MNRHEEGYGAVLASLRRETERDLDPELESRLLQRIELGIAGLATPGLDSLRGAERGASEASLADTYSASLALHPVATLVTTLALGGVLGAAVHARVESSAVSLNTDTNVVRVAPVAPLA